jgi:N-acetylneuraminic acid mutarotase
MSSPSPSERLRRHVATIAAAALLLTAGGCGGDDGGGGGVAIGEWEPAPQLTHRRSYPASVEIDGKIYVAAGMVGETGKPLDFLERFDPEAGEWVDLAPLPVAFSAAAGAEFQGRFWVIGGNNSKEVDGRQVYSYDLAADSWRQEARLPATRMNHAAVAFRGKLYALGGLAPANPTRTVFVYDPAARRWTEGTPMPVALHAHAAAVYRDEIWVFGGRDRTLARQRGVWIYNLDERKWRQGPALPQPMDTLSTAVNGDRIDALVDDFYFVFDGERWNEGPTLDVPRHALAAYTIDDTLYAVGGCLHPQLRDSTVVEKIEASA